MASRLVFLSLWVLWFFLIASVPLRGAPSLPWSTTDSTPINLRSLVSHFHFFRPIIIPHELKSNSLSIFLLLILESRGEIIGSLLEWKKLVFRLILGIYLLHTNALEGAEEVTKFRLEIDGKMIINNFYCVYGKPHKPFLQTWNWIGG